MTEKLLNQSVIHLYGRVVTDLTLDKPSSDGDGAQTRLQDQLSVDDAQLARVYGFEHDGHYYDLPSPAIFLVHGKGEKPADSGIVVEPNPELETKTAKIRVWTYDKADFSIRLDMQSGPLEEILLAVTRDTYSQIQSSGMHMKGMHMKGMHMKGMHMKGMHLKGGD